MVLNVTYVINCLLVIFMEPINTLLVKKFLKPSLEGILYFNKNLNFVKIALSITVTPVLPCLNDIFKCSVKIRTL